ncbi:HAL protein kinase [Fusarium oxysporum f. sp. lycopersici 4287]|uniref:non-specific serine/threonine protein kinase n=1 Tax=Fusarium oxysporum f. sp. lycopersici (strain 4287 / CBS 123668 / FGSC 9935 / NRRL 34936) TaxID=426428 RepID=A0A0J9V813_FUSO4|nr:HAL protein kinase [Fusarium oxysporum f. sp. lycopersici 4287]KNB07285.1 HAL protein kinase [Fusarium oxysporum f. sp. lycopersici 4287]
MSSSNPPQELPRSQGVSEASEPVQKPQESIGDKDDASEDASGVRFSSAVQEISPTQPAAVDPSSSNPEHEEHDQSSPFTEVTADQLKAFTKSLHGRPLQELRLNNCQFEAFSLPPSRVPSHEDESGQSTRLPTPTSATFQSPHTSPQVSTLASPPLTPAGSGQASSDKKGKEVAKTNEPPVITPQASSSHEKASPAPDRRPSAPRAASDHAVRRASSAEEQHQSHRRGMFGVGPGSVPASRESSPSRSSASNFYSKPFTPGGDINDPYAKGRRPAPAAHTTKHSIDPRFIFSRKKKHGSPHGSKSNLNEKRGSSIFGSARNSSEELAPNDSVSTGNLQPGHGSMADLKRFFRKGGHHNKKRESSPAPSIKLGTKAAASKSTQQLPFGDDHGLSSKYGKLGKFLGSGAGGSVRLMKRKDDGTVFAVKEFRARHTYETEKEYNKKVTAEFCVGSTLHHGNIIETLDILQEKGRWYEVMEYAPFDLFAIVMTGRMSREEITCCFLQILNGVTYLHSVGLAHRDLKLDNVVVSSKGIMKIIDFGSAHVFKYPFETDTVPAKGIVGSDPYLAPELQQLLQGTASNNCVASPITRKTREDLREQPFRPSYMKDDSTNDLTTTPARDFLAEDETKKHTHHEQKEEATSKEASSTTDSKDSKTQSSGDKKEVIRGPWRILRLLPRESRHIISRMLDLNPKTRARMDEILQEPWVADTVICQQFDHGEVVPADNHTHILEPPANSQQPEKK